MSKRRLSPAARRSIRRYFRSGHARCMGYGPMPPLEWRGLRVELGERGMWLVYGPATSPGYWDVATRSEALRLHGRPPRSGREGRRAGHQPPPPPWQPPELPDWRDNPPPPRIAK